MPTFSKISLTCSSGSVGFSMCMVSPYMFFISDATECCVFMISTICDHPLLYPFCFSWYRIVATTQYASTPRCRCAGHALSLLWNTGRRSRSVFRQQNEASTPFKIL